MRYTRLVTLDDIKAIPDAERRAREAQGFISRGVAALNDARAIRDSAILEWRQRATQRTIARALGLTPGLIGQIDTAAKEHE